MEKKRRGPTIAGEYVKKAGSSKTSCVINGSIPILCKRGIVSQAIADNFGFSTIDLAEDRDCEEDVIIALREAGY